MIQFKTLRTIYFSELYWWDVKRFLKSKMTSGHPLVALKKLIKQRKKKVKLFDFPEKEFGILGISKKKKESLMLIQKKGNSSINLIKRFKKEI